MEKLKQSPAENLKNVTVKPIETTELDRVFDFISKCIL